MARLRARLRRGGERSGQRVGYAALLTLAAGIAGAVFLVSPGVGGTVTDEMRHALCTVLGGERCDPPKRAAAVEERENCSDWARAEGASPLRSDDGSRRERQQIGTFNIYGHVGHEGGTEPIVTTVVDSVTYREPTFLGLQEVCESQASALQARLAPHGYTVYFVPTPVDAYDSGEYVTCGNGARFGDAIVYRADFADDMVTSGHELGTPDGQDPRKRMTCVSSESEGTVFCTAHLTTGSDDREEARKAEAENLKGVLADEYGDMTVLLGGDLNDEPDSDTLDVFYDPRYGDGADGSLKEADSIGHGDGRNGGCRDGEPTHRVIEGLPRYESDTATSKLDYVFVSNDVEIHGVDVKQPEDSDHDFLWSDVTF